MQLITKDHKQDPEITPARCGKLKDDESICNNIFLLDKAGFKQQGAKVYSSPTMRHSCRGRYAYGKETKTERHNSKVFEFLSSPCCNGWLYRVHVDIGQSYQAMLGAVS